MHYSQLLTLGNPKLLKGIARGYFPAVMHFAPAKRAARGTVCPWASKGCISGCLNTAGRGGIFRKGEYTNSIQKCRIRRTQWFFDNRPEFMDALVKAMRAHIKRANRKGLVPCIRLNGTSDIDWETVPAVKLSAGGYANIFQAFPDVQFYDYTKGLNRMIRYLDGSLPGNYHLTFSRSESNEAQVREVLRYGGNVAIVFKGSIETLQIRYGARVINGDDTDLRFADDPGVIVGLKAKGHARKDRSGFVVNVTGYSV